ncbi:hypothetical protein F511_25039 [Dorcoceras hygrometricum]|uniref:Uncharacterized protein n=1 Tax=Dorcoceras hygrometricum TaxID=472368 RepID=A0A2Z7CN08_9LAMI|nr:hypothetical protein F511_25039 [Dorcoceras hygrometricum]
MRRRPSFPPRAHARATTMRAGREWRLGVVLHDAQPLRMRRPRVAALPRARDARCGALAARLARGGRPLVARGCTLAAAAGQRWAALVKAMHAAGCAQGYAVMRAAVRSRAPLRRARFRGGAAGRPPLRRVSGDVVTAGLISSRVWFGPVPGSP